MTDRADSRPRIDLSVASIDARWRVEVVEESTSTNAEVADRFRAGEPEGLVLVAEHQTAGRGRLGREWVAPARSSLTVSFLLTPDAAGAQSGAQSGAPSGAPSGDRPGGRPVPATRWPWLPLLTGIAAAEAVRRVTGLELGLKWPNDVLAGGQKLGGILLERVEPGAAAGSVGVPGAIIGIGLNCSQDAAELPVPEATSLSLVTGAEVDRAALLVALTEELGAAYEQWRGGTDLRPAYLEWCSTVGQDVRVLAPGGEVTGRAVDVDESGQLVVRTEGGDQRLGAGDVVHVRPVA